MFFHLFLFLGYSRLAINVAICRFRLSFLFVFHSRSWFIKARVKAVVYSHRSCRYMPPNYSFLLLSSLSFRQTTFTQIYLKVLFKLHKCQLTLTIGCVFSRFVFYSMFTCVYFFFVCIAHVWLKSISLATDPFVQLVGRQVFRRPPLNKI